MAYPNEVDLFNMNETLPNGAIEQVAVLDDVDRETRRCVKNTFGAQHDLLTGAHSGASYTTAIAGAYSALITDSVILCDATGGAFDVTLPAVGGTGIAGKVFTIKKIDSTTNLVGIDGAGVETIDGVLAFYLGIQFDVMTIICDGTEWHVIDFVDNKFNVKHFGALGDGIADDTLAIQAAIDAVNAGLTAETYPSHPGLGNRLLGGGTLYFPRGIYLNTGLVTKSCITFQGDSSAASRLRLSGAGNDGITSSKTGGVFAVSRIIFKDIRIESNGDAAQSGVVMEDPDDCAMENVTITGFATYGLHMQKSQYFNANNLTVDTCGTGIFLDDDAIPLGCNNNTFKRLGIYGCGTGFDILNGTTNWLYGATIQNCSVVGLNIQAASNAFNISGGFFEFQQSVYDIVNAGRNTSLHQVFFVINPADTSRKVLNTGAGVMQIVECSTQGVDPQTVGLSRAILETGGGVYEVIGSKFGTTITSDEYVCDGVGSTAAAKGFAIVRTAVFSAVESNFELRKEMHATADVAMSSKIIGDASLRFGVDGGGIIYLEDGAGAGATIRQGLGTPEAAVTADPGSLFLRRDGGAGTGFYVKESGVGNVGWIAK